MSTKFVQHHADVEMHLCYHRNLHWHSISSNYFGERVAIDVILMCSGWHRNESLILLAEITFFLGGLALKAWMMHISVPFPPPSKIQSMSPEFPLGSYDPFGSPAVLLRRRTWVDESTSTVYGSSPKSMNVVVVTLLERPFWPPPTLKLQSSWWLYWTNPKIVAK